MKKIVIPNKIANRTERHIRWNWEHSPDNFELVRYHFIVVDDKDRKGIMNKIIRPLHEYDSLIKIRERQFDIKNSKNKALFHTYDSSIRPGFLELYNLRKKFVNDFNLYERAIGTLDDYVENFFWKD